MSDTTPGRIERALTQHREHVDTVLQSGDPAAVKQLYIELGELLEGAAGDDPSAVPVLSLPETAPIVSGLLHATHGLLLDAGCGPNPALAVLLGQDPARTVVGVDIGLGTVRLARSITEHQPVRFLAVVADVEALPFRARSFDGLVCDDTVEHLPDDRRGVSELARVVKTDGRCVLATPNRHSAQVLYRRTVDLARGRPRPRSAYFAATSHLREYTWPQLERLFGEAFRIEHRAAVGWNGGRWHRVASRLVARPPLRRFSRMVVVAGSPKG